MLINNANITGSLAVVGTTVLSGSLAVSTFSGSGVRYLVSDGAGNMTAQTASAAIKNAQAYTASAGQTVFPVTNGYTTNLVDVYINGSKLLDGLEYNDTSGTNIVLTTGSFAGDIVEVVTYQPASGVTNNSLRTLTSFTATAGQTTFSASYVPGLLDVYYNGSRLNTIDYTAANGNSIVLTTGSNAGDILDVLVYSYQVGAFSGIGGTGTANQLTYWNTTSSITGSTNLTYNGSVLTLIGNKVITVSGSKTIIGNNIITGSMLISGSGNPLQITTNSGSFFISSSGFVGMNTTQSNNSTLTVAPLKTPGVAFQVIADGAGRATSIYTSDFSNLTSGSSLRFGLTGGSGNVNSSIQAYIAGENATGSLLLNSAGGNVGIGTSNPSSSLDVNLASESPATGRVALIARTGNGNNDIFRWYDGTTQLGVFKNSGNVGIGTTSDNYRLEVNANAATWATRIYNASATGNGLVVVTQNTTTAAGLALYNGTSYVLYARNDGAVGINTSSPSGKLDVNGRVYIRTAGSSTDAAITFINQSGGDGTLYVTGTSTSLNYQFNTYATGNALYIYNNGNYSFAGSNVSDRRLKENIATIELNAIEKINQLVPKSYNMIAHPGIKRHGFIAQEVKEIIPDFVIGEETDEDYLGVDYNGILALTIKALQEANAKITALEEKLERNNIQ